MKKIIKLLAFAGIVFCGCVQNDILEPEVEMQTITVSAGMGTDTKAGVSDEGTFTWHATDAISVLATNGLYYTLTLTEGAGTKYAKFSGSVPVNESITTVGTYPALVENGTSASIYNADSKTLTFNLPSEYTYAAGYANVPMVSSFGEGAEEMAFKHIGALIRIPLNGMPANSKVIITMSNRKIAGDFALAFDKVGSAEGVISTVSGTEGNTVTVNYTATTSGQTAEINLPLPTGTYEDLTLSVKNANDENLFTKTYDLSDLTFGRANILVLDAEQVGPIGINKIYPFFVDARVFWAKAKGVDKYALYVDDSDTPVIVSTEKLSEEDGVYSYMIGGDFKHGTSHTVAVAPVINDAPVDEMKSEAMEFTTAEVRQITYNTGTKFICAGWDDVAVGIENSTKYNPENGRWIPTPQNSLTERNIRGYRVQLYAADKETKLYDEIPFSGQCDYGGTFVNSTWLGMSNGSNILLPTSLSFGWLEPGTTYYFRVQTLEEPVLLDSPEDGIFEPSTQGYTLSSPRGGCAWSDFVEMKTDEEYVMGAQEVFHEGFDDMMFNSDIMNISPAAVPEVLTSATDKDSYENRKSAEKYKTWVAKDFSERKFSEQAFNTMLNVYEHGLTDNKCSDATTPRVLNSYAGSLEGWSVLSPKEARNVYPNFGAIRLGQSGSSANGAEVRTSAIASAKLSDEKATQCIITLKVSSAATKTLDVVSQIGINHYRPDAGGLSKIDATTIDYSKGADGNILSDWSANYNGTDGNSDYLHMPVWFEVKTTLNLKNGDIIGFEKFTGQDGCIVIGDVKIEIDPSATDDDSSNRYYGTKPDGTKYDVWGMNGKMPITFWMGPPALDQTALHTLDEATLATYKATYFDPIVEGGYNLIECCNPWPESMKIILDWCAEAGVRMIDKSIGDWSVAGAPAQMDRIANYADHPAYAGAFVGYDEPGAKAFLTLDALNDAYASRFPTKGRTINLFPGYANTCQLNCGNGVCDNDHSLVRYMTDYMQYFADNVSVNNYMFDHYCLSKSDKNGKANRGEVKSYQYSDLDLFRHHSLAKRVPFLMITHGRPQWDPGYSATIANSADNWKTDVSATALPPKPDDHVYDEQRWLVWSQLALGSKGVSYFCYWTPYGFKGGPFSFHYDGTKTRMYDILKNINQEIQPIGTILMTCHADGAMMTNPSGFFSLYENEGMGLSNYGPVLELTRGNAEDVVAGCFRDASTGEYKVLVTHKAPATNDTEAATASIANLKIDTQMVTSVKLHTVTLTEHNAAASTIESTVDVSSGMLTLSIPDGTAVLVEFPETANVSYN